MNNTERQQQYASATEQSQSSRRTH